MASRCKEKYGQEWSEGLTQTTLKYFDSCPSGFVKRINREHGIARVVGAQIQVANPDSGKIIGTYVSAQDLVDDGWAVD